ncbi:thiamine ABC transporter substrate-binding protein [Nocardioides sp. CBS4Y-1]|uniref:Thiamine ABC transporter substrate-binding protein n=1 Tax=Nocardioides acrostichi TaxID=2784339 RepID=A0A930V0D5_9ACTN|nr:thiamine ABC transporter substrate-binding protein [Nocardioides acrostichi]
MAFGVLLTSGCSLIGSESDTASEPSSSGGASSSAGGTVVLVTHDSFSLPKKLIRSFESDTGYTLEQRALGDAGALTSQLVLNADNPVGDVAFGVDNTFGSRAVDAGVFTPYEGDRPDGVDAYDLPGDDDGDLTPIDNGDVCVNVDTSWFDKQGLTPPETFDDLIDPQYEDLFVTEGATTSSPGFAFLLATIAAKGEDGWQDYWKKLLANGTKVDKGWEDAYYVDFTGGGKGDRPIVTSYDSSPAFTTDGNGGTTTAALLDTCFEQIEYAGVLSGAKNPEGAQAVVDWLLSPAVQKALPTSMYVFPVVDDTPLPKDWASFAKRPTDPWTIDPASVDEHRDQWLQEWTDLVSQ